MQNLQPLYGAPNAERVFRTCEVRTRSTTFLCHRCFGADRFFLCHRCFGADRFLLHDTGTSLMVDFSTSFGIGKAAVTQRDGQDSPEYRPWSIMLQGPHIVASLFLVGQGSNYIGHFVLAAGRLLVFCTAGLLRAACSEWNSDVSGHGGLPLRGPGNVLQPKEDAAGPGAELQSGREGLQQSGCGTALWALSADAFGDRPLRTPTCRSYQGPASTRMV